MFSLSKKRSCSRPKLSARSKFKSAPASAKKPRLRLRNTAFRCRKKKIYFLIRAKIGIGFSTVFHNYSFYTIVFFLSQSSCLSLFAVNPGSCPSPQLSNSSAIFHLQRPFKRWILSYPFRA